MVSPQPLSSQLNTRLSLLAAALIFLAGPASAQVISLPLTTSASNKLNAGSFAGGTQLLITATGTGDLVDARYQVNGDGSMAAAATGVYSFANQGATYSTEFGGDGINHFAGGGANTDLSGSYGLAGFGFAGATTTDTTDPTAIRGGAVVGTFVANPARADWFLLGSSATVTVPNGGADLFLAVNDSYSPDNHGTFSVTLQAIPEPPSFAAFVAVAVYAVGSWRRRQKSAASRPTP
jgi:hypothetical protein